MKPSLYLETTIPSFLVGDVSPVLITAAHQAATRLWWTDRRSDYRLFVSALVVEEISQGTRELAEERLALISGLPRLAVTAEVEELADELQRLLGLPPTARADAVHVAAACHYAIDYLLTWNLKHIASGRVRKSLDRFHDATGRPTPTICTPEELLDWSDEL